MLMRQLPVDELLNMGIHLFDIPAVAPVNIYRNGNGNRFDHPVHDEQQLLEIHIFPIAVAEVLGDGMTRDTHRLKAGLFRKLCAFGVPHVAEDERFISGMKFPEFTGF